MKAIISHISRYRTELMGAAIIGVMLAHIKSEFIMPDSIFSKALGVFCYCIFTGGFIFLSGLGLYFSFQKDYNIKRFYCKRFLRLIIPYWIISTPYFAYTDIYINHNPQDFLCHFTTLSFWLNGNYSGMWYISFSVVLYILYPLMHHVLYKKRKFSPIITASILCIIISLIKVALNHTFSHFYEITDVIWNKWLLFIWGSLTMYVIQTREKISENRRDFPFIITLCICITANVITDNNGHWDFVNIFSIVVVAYLFSRLHEIAPSTLTIFRWFGKYSLELYVIHMLLFHLFSRFDLDYRGRAAVMIAILICRPVHNTCDIVASKIKSHFPCQH